MSEPPLEEREPIQIWPGIPAYLHIPPGWTDERVAELLAVFKTGETNGSAASAARKRGAAQGDRKGDDSRSE